MLLLCALIVGSSNVWADYYEKVTSTDDITDGQYLIVYEDGNVAFDGGLSTLDATSNTIEVTISESKIVSNATTNAAAFTIDVTNGTILSASGNYIGVSSNSNGLKVSDKADTYSNSFSIDGSGNAVISAVFSGSTMTMRYNSSSGQTRFRYYKSGQQAIQLYKLKASSSPLSSIALSGTYPTVFHQGDTFTHDGIVVTATYGDSSTKDVTSSVSFSTPDMSTTGTKTITVSYTENEVTKTATYDISVNAPATLTSISLSGTYTTTFTQGDSFEHDGLIVTANYDDTTSKVVTGDASFSSPDMSTVGTQTITVSYTENGVTKEVTYDITVNDYATLPFSWAGGASADLKALTGVTVNADNSDYAAANSPYLVKFNGTGKYIIIKTDSQPGIVTIGAKMIGGATSSTITIQESADGETYTDIETLTISGSSNDVVNLTSTKAFMATSRYVKLYYTKGSNIGVGPINIYKSISDASDYTPSAMNGVNLTVYRKFVTGWNGIVLPFDLTNDVKTALGATDVKTLNDATESEGTITLEFADAALPVAAGTPVLIKLSAAIENPSFEDVNLKATTPTSVVKSAGGNTYTLAGTYSNVDLMDSEAYFVSNDKFYHKAAGVALTAAPFRAYIVQTGATPVRLLFNLEGETTGIHNTQFTIDNEANAPVYNLNGQRVAQPTRGLYIVNGKKVVIK